MTDLEKIKPFEKPIYVANPFLPALDDFSEGLKEIWENLLAYEQWSGCATIWTRIIQLF